MNTVTKSGEPANEHMTVELGHEPTTGALPAPEEKHRYVREMFDAIAPRYDLLNSLLSVRLHHHWRKVAASQARLRPGDRALDVCTGTGDLAIELARRVGPKGRVVGGDFSLPMLRLGAEKADRRTNGVVRMALADAQRLPFPDNAFDAATVAFGIRNVSDIPRGIAEMARVVRPGGRVVLLEFSQPTNPVFAALYRWYSSSVMPLLGGLVSGRRSAYEYLPSSVRAFHSREEIAALMEKAGLRDVTVKNLTFGTVAIHCGVKNEAAGGGESG